MLQPRAHATVCLLMLVALAHQLGASPCGCYEHSGWRQAIELLCGEAHDSVPSGDRRLSNNWAFDADDCEHTAPIAAIVPQRVVCSYDATGCFNCGACVASLESAVSLAPSRLLNPAAYDASAPSVRARAIVLQL